MITMCKKTLEIAQYIDSDGSGHQVVLSMPFTSKSGFGDAQKGLPQLHVKIHATLLEVRAHALNEGHIGTQGCPSKGLNVLGEMVCR